MSAKKPVHLRLTRYPHNSCGSLPDSLGYLAAAATS
jgi:hypothetical protein